MRILISCIFCCFCFSVLQGQTTVYVKDAESKLPLSYSTVECLQKHWGVYSDVAGKISIPDSIRYSDNLIFTYVGYDTLNIHLEEGNEIIYLKKHDKQLQNIIITSCTEKQIVKIKNRNRSSNSSLGLDPNSSGFVWSAYVENPGNKNGIVKTISFGVVDFFRGKKLDAPVRIHFYEMDTISNRPGDEINSEVIEIIPKRTGWITVDISNYNIHIPASGFVVGFDMFDAGPQFHFIHFMRTEKWKGGTERQIECYGWDLEALNDGYGFKKIPGIGWTGNMTNRESFKYSNVPAVGISFEICK